jgi:GH15 family glucan-1,4-alpha-glucosidase
MPPELPSIAEYGLIADCHGGALVSLGGAIDWCCLTRFDSGACFARLLDPDHGGHCSIAPDGGEYSVSREYLAGTLVLVTKFSGPDGDARLIDCFLLPGDSGESHGSRILRIVEGRRGRFDFRVHVAPRFDYGAMDPWIRHQGLGVFSAIGGDDAMVIWSDASLEPRGRHELEGTGTVRSGERAHLLLASTDPVAVDDEDLPRPDVFGDLDQRLEETIERWRDWVDTSTLEGPDAGPCARSAIVLKALTYEPTGAVVAAPTTSLPGTRGGGGARNWDYRFSWIRDSALAARSLAELGFEGEAGAFRRFVERSAAGNAKDLQVTYGIGGERRLKELELEHLPGYRGARPVRIGNDAAGQLQLDGYGQLLDQSWSWYQRGHEPDDDYWRFLVELVEAAAEGWEQPDAGIWEWRGEPKHFVHSKALAWVAVDRGLRLAEHCMRKAPESRWRRTRDEIRAEIEERGYDEQRGVFVQAFDGTALDAALLRLPTVEFVDYGDERMVRTVDAIREELDLGGLLRRYSEDDSLEGEEAAFVACAFWLVECLAGQGRLADAQSAFDRAMATANDLGLFAEQYDPEADSMLGNFPQALSHLSHVEATLALIRARERADERAAATHRS